MQLSKTCQGFTLRRSRCKIMAVAVALVGGVSLTSCQEYDLDEKTPDGYGASIYSWLDGQGNFTNTVRLINDLNYREVLDKTGSKTFFAANDAAFSKLFEQNDWGVKCYEDLSVAQKRMLLFGAMIDNSYQIQALSSTEGPIEGNCMRRLSTQSIYDTVQIMHSNEVPDGIYWENYQGRDLVLMHDMTPTPMIHFIERHLNNKQITNDDYNFLFNYKTNRQSGDASVNGTQIITPNIKCMNGFVNETDKVMTPLSNMADIINTKKNTTIFARLLKRYSVPDYCGDEVTHAYNTNRGTQVDSVFQLRYFAKRSQGGKEFTSTHNQKSKANGELKFDPGWNSYYILSNATAETALQQDMAVMLVPSDSALTEYWENGAGATFKKNYGTWENMPYSIVTEFLNANMLASFVSSVPSKFGSILNDAADPMGLTKDDIDQVWLACNGAIYLTKRVFTPTSFVSVMYPAVVDQNMSIMHWAIKELNFGAYLNSLNSRYSFFLPSNDALLEYIDPASYGKPQQQMLRFHYDPQRKGNEVYASIHNIDSETGEVGDSINVYTNTGGKSLDWNPILNRLYTILNDHVVIGDVEDGHEYYRTKGGSTIRVKNVAQGANGMKVEGSRQVNGESPEVSISEVYDQTNGGNGKTYILNQGPILGSRQTVFNILGQHPEFSKFRELLEGSDLLETIHDGRYACSDTCISVFNNFHYTIYVPTNESIQKLIDTNQLVTWEDVDKLDTTINSQKEQYKKYISLINNFLRYHIQDNSLYIGADNISANATLDNDGSTTKYETAYIYTEKSNKIFKRLEVTSDKAGSFIRIKDEAGNTRKVVTEKPGLYNLMATEYTYNNDDKSTASSIHGTSSAVIHLIDGPLLTK